jgi:(p)ppGpp synthase/HD superfamily hydrolase
VGALVEQAKLWGGMKHKGQTRKYTGEAYFTHCEAVAEAVSAYYELILKEEAPDEVIAAALLHDTVEDTDATQEDIEEIFGETVARYVWFLTKPPEFVGNRATRKTVYNAYLAQAPTEVKIIKFFDMKHNAKSIEEYDPKFWETFRGETIRMMIALDIPDVTKHYQGFIDSL